MRILLPVYPDDRTIETILPCSFVFHFPFFLVIFESHQTLSESNTHIIMSALPIHQTLRHTVLRNAIPLVPQHSFTRAALLSSIRQLPVATASADSSPLQTPEALLESLFGKGVEPEKSLVREWEAQGLQSMKDAFPGRSVEGSDGVVAVTTGRAKGKAQKEVDFPALKSALGRRILWSSETAKEHLVQVRTQLDAYHKLGIVAERTHDRHTRYWRPRHINYPLCYLVH